jgi:hypothetical protein
MNRLLTAGVLALSLVAAASAAQSGGAATQTKVNPDARIAADFIARVNAYVELHRRLEDTLPKLSTDATPESINTHQRNLSRMIADARRGAKPGDIFTRETRALFRRYLSAVFGGPDGRQLKASINDENPGPVKVGVNQPYPNEIPLATMPPQVLQWLPQIPDELQYRFIGDRLVLLDVHAHLVVDLIEDALPN